MSAASSEIANLVHEILIPYQTVRLELDKPAPPMLFDSVREMRQHLSSLVFSGFVGKTSLQHLRIGRSDRYVYYVAIYLCF